jgi:hypothetical protein
MQDDNQTAIQKAGQLLKLYQSQLNTPKLDGAVVIAAALLAVAGELERHTALPEEHNARNRKQIDLYTEMQQVQMAILDVQMAAAEQAKGGAA